MIAHTTESELLISIVTPAYNAASTIGRLLEAIAGQTFDAKMYELIIIDDGSTDDTCMLIESFIKDNPLITIRLVRKSHVGPGQARNEGIAQARGLVVAFTDADCKPDYNWLAAVWHEFQEGHKVVSGLTYSNDLIIYPWKISPAGQRGITANLAIVRDALAEERFSPRFNGLYGEDTDLLRRLAAKSADYKVWESDAMRVEHPVNEQNIAKVIQRAKARVNEVLLLKLYGKEVYSSMNVLYRPLFFGRFSALFIGTSFLLLLTITAVLANAVPFLLALYILGAGLFVAAGYKFLVHNSEKSYPITLIQRIKTLGYFGVYNLALLASRVEGSVRHRTIVI